MAEVSKNDAGESVKSTETEIKRTEKKKGVLSRLWNSMFRVRGDDFEKRLEHISKEEAAILARISRRSHSWRRMIRHLIIISLLSEVIAVGYAIMSTRSLDLHWKIRALRVFPMFLLPVFSLITYSMIRGFTRMRDQKDQKTLEKLRTERQAKIDELKERTNYYITQQLIQRYDSDPAAKAAAATVLASKLGADTGLKVHVEGDSILSAPTGMGNDAEAARNTGLRQRKLSNSRTSSSVQPGSMNHPDGGMLTEFEGADLSQQHSLVVEHHTQTGVSSSNEGWIARLAALLVGEDPTQSYALICGNCHMHNGLAKREDFPYIAYYCPHCKALNQSKQSAGHAPGSNSPGVTLSNVAETVADADCLTEDTVQNLNDSTTTAETVPSPANLTGTSTAVAVT